MSKKDQTNDDRRTLLKAISGSVGAIALNTGITTASSSSSTDVLQEDKVATMLAAVGDPEILDEETKTVSVPGNTSFEKTEIKTDVGSLIFSNFPDSFVERSSFDAQKGKSTVHFLFDELKGQTRQQIPDRFRSLPGYVELGLFYEDGKINARRTATKQEIQKLADVADVPVQDLDDATPVYDENEGVFLFPQSENALAYVYLDESHPVEHHNDAFRALDAGRFELEIEQGEESDVSAEQTWQGGDCWGGWGAPCVQCVFGSGVCGVCSAGCSLTGGVGCIACIASCAGTGGSCGCCLSCDSNVHNPVCY